MTSIEANASSLSPAPPPQVDPKYKLDTYGTLTDVSKHPYSPTDLIQALSLCQASSLELVSEILSSKNHVALVVASEINPPLWSLGHVAYFYEFNVLNILNATCTQLKRHTFFNGHDREELFDSIRIDREERCASNFWRDMSSSEVPHYYRCVQQDMEEYLLTRNIAAIHPVDAYLFTYAIIHEHWHIEDLWCMLNKIGLPPPERRVERIQSGETNQKLHDTSRRMLTAGNRVLNDQSKTLREDITSSKDDASSKDASSEDPSKPSSKDPSSGESEDPSTNKCLVNKLWCRIEGGVYYLGATRSQDSFVFDQEKWSHPVDVATFDIARLTVTNAAFLEFVKASNGYQQREHWSSDGWRWRTKNNIKCPEYWQDKGDEGWHLLMFGTSTPLLLLAHHPVAHISWWEAEAYCKWRGDCRLPTEAEWEVAAVGIKKERAYPWGTTFDTLARANIDRQVIGTVAVDAFSNGDSIDSECRQMIGNVWEWTSTSFYPYPGYVTDFPYRENSAPWFGFSKVARGGAWCTTVQLAHATHRNFYDPGGRREVPVGFRVVKKCTYVELD